MLSEKSYDTHKQTWVDTILVGLSSTKMKRISSARLLATESFSKNQSGLCSVHQLRSDFRRLYFKNLDTHQYKQNIKLIKNLTSKS